MRVGVAGLWGLAADCRTSPHRGGPGNCHPQPAPPPSCPGLTHTLLSAAFTRISSKIL